MAEATTRWSIAEVPSYGAHQPGRSMDCDSGTVEGHTASSGAEQHDAMGEGLPAGPTGNWVGVVVTRARA